MNCSKGREKLFICCEPCNALDGKNVNRYELPQFDFNLQKVPKRCLKAITWLKSKSKFLKNGQFLSLDGN